MNYILSEFVALRSWELVPYAFYQKNSRDARTLKKDEFELLLRCDGEQDIEDSFILQSLLDRGLCRPAKGKERLSEWQKLKKCDNRYFPAVNWMITGRCNYNCLHCFNASDNSRLQSEYTLEEAEKLIEEAEKCGINAITLTGGEPMLHPHFMDIVQKIYAHGMYVESLTTNGYFLTQEILDALKKIGCRPLIKISFDGIGHHDWLRNRKGAEADALRAIRLCIENEFPVRAQTNVHRLNVDSMLPTARLLNDLGVDEMRIIRTTESPRWLKNAGDACLTLQEYFDRMIAFLQAYTKSGCKMDIDIWQLVQLHPYLKSFHPSAINCTEEKYRDSLPVCRGNRGMAAVGANGHLYPCHQMSGYYEQHHWFLGNVKTDGLQKCLKESSYLQTVCTTVRELAEHNKKCAQCQWFKYCCGGCRAIGLALTEDVFGSDLSKCLFFEGGYMNKLMEALPGYHMQPLLNGRGFDADEKTTGRKTQ